jgi:hypothetical protein
MNPKRRHCRASEASGARLALRLGSRKARHGWLTATLALALGVLVVSPASAAAAPARYVFEMCDSALPGGGVSGVGYFQSPANGPFDATDNCSQPTGSLAISQTGFTPSQYAYWRLPIAPPPGGRMESITITALSCGGAGTVAFAFFESWPPSDTWPTTDCQLEQVRTFSLDNPVFPFWVWLGCDSNNSEGCPGSWIYAHYFATTEVDPVAPTLAGLEGSLLSGDTVRGHQTLSVKAHDEGGGISNVSVSVNGLPAAQPQVSNCDVAQVNNPSVQGTVAAAITPCPTETKADWTLDTQAYPFHDGENTVQVCASDFATLSNPNTTCSPAQTVDVDNSCTESPVSGGETLSAQFSASKSDTITVGYGKDAAVTGQLTDSTGDPVPGATLCVKMQALGVEPSASPVGTVTTDANGSYIYKVPPGPDRAVVIGYRHDAFQVEREVRYYAHAGPSLKLAPRSLADHHRVRFWGQVPGPNGGGRVIVLQANVPGSRQWITFRKATTNSEGDFQSAYKFTSTTRTTTYRFRAVVPAQSDYPWVEGASRPAKVLVRG